MVGKDMTMKKWWFVFVILAALLLNGCAFLTGSVEEYDTEGNLVKKTSGTYGNLGRKFAASVPVGSNEAKLSAGVDQAATDAILKGIELGRAIK